MINGPLNYPDRVGARLRLRRQLEAGADPQAIEGLLDAVRVACRGLDAHIYRCHALEGVSVHVDLFDDTASDEIALVKLFTLGFTSL